MKTLKTVLLVLTFLLAISCERDIIEIEPYSEIPEVLKINDIQGIRLERYIVKEDVSINLKSPSTIVSRIKIKDIEDRLVSQEQIKLIQGNNLLKIYVKSLPLSSYTIEVEDKTGRVVGTEIFSLIK